MNVTLVSVHAVNMAGRDEIASLMLLTECLLLDRDVPGPSKQGIIKYTLRRS